MRTADEITDEYLKLCSQAGDIQYRILSLEEELLVVNRHLGNLVAELISANNTPRAFPENPSLT